MRTREEYIETLERYHKLTSNTRIEKVINEFSLEKMEDILAIKKDSDTMIHSYWEYLYNRNKENDDVLLEMIRTNKCPMDIIEKILYNTETFKKDIIHSYERKKNSLDSEMFMSALKYDISQPLFDTVYKYCDSNILSLFDSQYSYKQEEIKQISDSSIEKICEKIRENYTPPKTKMSYYSSSNIDHKVDCFQHIRDHQYIKKLMGEDLHENIRTSLLNNVNLHPENPLEAEMMNEIYDGGCVIEYIKNWTPYIKREITSSLYDAYLTCIDETTGKVISKPSSLYYDSKHILADLAEKEALDEDYEYDLGLRLLDQKERSTDRLINSVFCHTKNPNLMSRIKDIKSGDKVDAYSKNKYLTPDVVKERVNELMKKIKKYIDKGEERKIPDVWFDYLADYAKKIPFDLEQYKLLATYCEKKLALSIATSSKTPKDSLLEFVKTYKENSNGSWYSYVENTVALGALTNIYCRENGINEKTYDNLMKYFFELPSSTTKDDIDGKTYHNNLSYATQSLRHTIEYGDINDARKVYNFFKDLLAKEITEKEKNVLEYSIAIMDKNFKIKDDEKRFENETDTSKFTDEYLNERKRKVNHLLGYFPTKINVYTSLEEHFDEINKIYEECEKRGHFIEKEKEEPEK